MSPHDHPHGPEPGRSDLADADACCAPPPPPAAGTGGAYRRALSIVLALNALMFAVEIVSGVAARSMALQADALDFLGDSFAYAIALAVLGRGLRWRASVALLKGLSMAGFGLWVIGAALYHAWTNTVPAAAVMGSVGFAALAVNLVCTVILFRHRQGDANMRSIWLCTRNDALGNIAVMAAAGAVGVTATGWADYAVAGGMAALALSSGIQVVRLAGRELADRAAEE